jgi:hypothetical protein
VAPLAATLTERIQRRAEKFKVVNPEEEKRKRRMERFGPPPTVTPQDKLKQRAERFKVVAKPGDLKAVNAMTAEQKTALRLAKFASKHAAASNKATGAKAAGSTAASQANGAKLKKLNPQADASAEERQKARLQKFGITKYSRKPLNAGSKGAHDPATSTAAKLQRLSRFAGAGKTATTSTAPSWRVRV